MKYCAHFYLVAFCCVLAITAGCGSVASHCNGTGNCNGAELVSVVAISRHGIRSPTTSQAVTNLDTLRPEGFPLWPAPANVPGDLSAKGRQNATLLGSWYRDFYASQGLLPPKGSCPAAGAVFVYADVFERTLDTAQAYVDGMFQSEATADCGIKVKSSDGAADPYIDTAAAGVCEITTDVDLAEFNRKIGGSSAALMSTYSSQLQTLQAVTQCCQPSACATAENPNPASCTLFDLPDTINTTGAVSFAKGTVFNVADQVTESLELEYAEGMPETGCENTPGAPCVGWASIPPDGLQDLTKLHVVNMVNLMCQLPSFAQVGSSNLMWQMVGTMDQDLSGVTSTGILAPVQSKFTLFIGHDENLSAIAKFLGGVTWKADGFQANDPGPAGALVFELWKAKPGGKPFVRLYYVIASLDQMRNSTTLTLETPPQRIPLPIPACGGRLDCPYDELRSFVTSHVRADCLIPAISKARAVRNTEQGPVTRAIQGHP